MTLNDPRLTAYALDELDDAERQEVEAAVKQSPALAAEVEAIRAAATTLEAAFVAEPALALTEAQRRAIDPSRRREPADIQSVERKRHDSPSRDRKGAGPGEGSKVEKFNGSRVQSERGAEATRSPRPNFLRRFWVPTTLAASLTLAATAYYVTLPSLSRARLIAVVSNRSPSGETVDLAMPARGTEARNSGDSSVPDFGSGIPQIDLAKTKNPSNTIVSAPTGDFAARKKAKATPSRGESNGPAVFGGGGGSSPSESPTDLSATRVYWEKLGRGEVSIQQFVGPSSGAEPEQLENRSYGFQVPFGPRDTRAREGMDEDSTKLLTGALARDTRAREGMDNPQTLAADRGPFYSGGIQVLSTGFETPDWDLGYSVRGDEFGFGVTCFYPASNLLGERSTGDAYAPVFDNPFHLVAHQPLSTFSIDVDTASYSNVRRILNAGALPPRDAVRIEEIVNYFDYDYPLPTDGRPFSVNVETSDCPWSPTHRLARIGIKGMEFTANQRPAVSLVFLIDVSGSMQDANKLQLVQQALRMLVGELRRDDQVAMVVYAGASGLVLPATKCHNHGTILEAIDRLQAGGSTNGGAGIQLAYETAEANFIEGGVNRVILATDGDFNVGVTNGGELTALIEEKAKGGVFLTVLGFGMGNLKDATLEALADKGNGNYAYIDTLAEAKKTLVDQIGGTLVTIAKDVKIQVEFNPAQVSSYRLIGYENRLLAARDFNDDTKDAGEIGAGHTVTAFYEIVPAGESVDDGGVDALKYQSGASHEATKPRSHEESEPGAEATGLDLENAETPKRRNAESGEPTADGQDDSEELMTVKLRYKAPDGDVSELIEVPVVDSGETFADSSDDLAFALSAASLGMLLRGYPTSENFDFDFVHELATGSMGDDESGYRAEFVELVNRARVIAAADHAHHDAR